MRNSPPTERSPLTEDQRSQLAALENQPDTNDIPQAPAENWQFAYRLYKPRKEAISLRLDADVLEWLRSKGPRYQTEINRLLREKMEESAGAEG
jgi:uncharacterized protein (DUF4415 family)